MSELTVACVEAEDLLRRRRIVAIGLWVTVGVVASSSLYLLLTPAGPHRVGLLLTGAVAAVAALAVIALGRSRLPFGSAHDALLTAWNLTTSVVVTVAAVLDGEPSTPYPIVFFVCVAFASVALPPLAVVAVAAVDLGGLAVIAAATGAWPADLLVVAAALVAIAVIGTAVADQRWRREAALRDAQDELFRRLRRVARFRDDETGAHMERMGEACRLLALELGWTPLAARELRSAAAMHDIGKLAIPDEVLAKPGPLSDRERAIMQTHTTLGCEMLSGSPDPVVRLAADVANTHHERWDGTGYPRGLAGEAIPLAGRIAAVADVFDALTSPRVYRPAMPLAEALEILAQGRGTQFDPAVLDAFAPVPGRLGATAGA